MSSGITFGKATSYTPASAVTGADEGLFLSGGLIGLGAPSIPDSETVLMTTDRYINTDGFGLYLVDSLNNPNALLFFTPGTISVQGGGGGVLNLVDQGSGSSYTIANAGLDLSIAAGAIASFKIVGETRFNFAVSQAVYVDRPFTAFTITADNTEVLALQRGAEVFLFDIVGGGLNKIELRLEGGPTSITFDFLNLTADFGALGLQTTGIAVPGGNGTWGLGQEGAAVVVGVDPTTVIWVSVNGVPWPLAIAAL